MEEDFKFDICGFCEYCHGSINVGEDYDCRDGGMYHKECWEIKNRYADTFDIAEDN